MKQFKPSDFGSNWEYNQAKTQAKKASRNKRQAREDKRLSWNIVD